MADATTTPARPGRWRTVLSIGACAVLLAGAAGATWLIRSTEPTAESESASRRTAALVETVTVTRGTHLPVLQVLGTVEPSREVVLSPQVAGRIVRMESALVPGGIVADGAPLLELERADYEQVVTVREAELRQVEAELAIEQGRQAAARQEYELLGEDIDPANRALVLREPQIASIRARVRAAEAALAQARLDLERTVVRAPFHAQVLERTANLGSQVSPGDGLAMLVGVDEYWITASVPMRELRRLRFAGGDDAKTGSAVRIAHPAAWGPGVHREGRVTRLVGALDRETRLARVLVTVADPLGEETGAPSLLLGSIVELAIEGEPLEDVVRIDRDHLRRGDTVWVMHEGALEIRPVEVVYRDAEHAFIAAGLEAGETIVVTDLATVTDGLPLRRTEADDVLAGRRRGEGAS